MLGLANLLGQPCTVAVHLASQDVLVYPAPHEDRADGNTATPPPPGPDSVLSGIVEVFAPSERHISAIRVVLRNSQTIAIPDTSSAAAGATAAAIRYEDACTFSRTIEITAEHHLASARSHQHYQHQHHGRNSRPASLSDASALAQAAASPSASASTSTSASASSETTPGIFLPRGSSFFAFSFILPATLAPTTRSKNGRLRYACSAIAVAGGRARSNVASPPREIFVIALPQPDSHSGAAQPRASLINQAEGFNAPGMPAPISLDVQFHDYHDALGIVSVALTSLSLTVGSIATLSIYHPNPPPDLNVHLVRVTIEQTAEVYNRLRRGWVRFPVEKYRLWEAGYMPFKKSEDQPLRPRRLGTVTAALSGFSDSGYPGQLANEPPRRAAEWEDSIWVAAKDGSKGRPGNAILDRLYVNADVAAAAAAGAVQDAMSKLTHEDNEHPERRRPGPNATSYFGSRPPSPTPSPSNARKTRSMPTTPAAHAHGHVHGTSSAAHTPGHHGSTHLSASELRPHPNPLYATACDHPTQPFLSALSGAWVDKPVQPSSGDSTAPSTTSTASETPSAYRLRALLRLPSDDVLHPTSLRGTRSEIHHTHEACIEIFFSRNKVLSEEKGKEGRPKIQVFSMRKNVVIQSCIVTPDMVHLPPYGGHEQASITQGPASQTAPDSVNGQVASEPTSADPPTYADATTPSDNAALSPATTTDGEGTSLLPHSPAIRISPSGSIPAEPTSEPGASSAPRGRPGFFRRISGSSTASGDGSTGANTSPGDMGEGSPRAGAEVVSSATAGSTVSHLRSTLSAILHPHSHHLPHGSGNRASHAQQAGAGSNASAASLASSNKRSGASAASLAGAVRMSTATAPPSRTPSRAASRESSPTRAGFSSTSAGGSSGRHTPPAHQSNVLVDGEAGPSSTTTHQPHHYRRNEFSFGFTPSSARKGEGQDAGGVGGHSHSHHGSIGHGSHRDSERHAHFIPAQVEGRERGRSMAGGGTAGSGGSGTNSEATSSPILSTMALPAHSPGGAGSGPLGGNSHSYTPSSGGSSGRLSRRASGQMSDQQLSILNAHGGQASSSATGPTPARLAHALRKLQLSQAQENRHGGAPSGAVAGHTASTMGHTCVHTDPSQAMPTQGQSRSAPGSGATTPGGTLVTSGPNMPPEWNLVMAPGEHTSTSHATCMCGRTTESLLRAERLLLVGAPTAPHFTPSSASIPIRRSLPSLSTLSAGTRTPEGVNASRAAPTTATAESSNGLQTTTTAPAPPRATSASASTSMQRSHSSSAALEVGHASSASPASAGTDPDHVLTNIGADDPEGILWSVGMGADGRTGGAGRWAATAAAEMRRSISAGGGASYPSSSTTTGPLLHSAGLHHSPTPSTSTPGGGALPIPVQIPLDANARTPLALEDLLPTDEFVLARGRDPDEIVRRKAELAGVDGASLSRR